MTVLSNISTMSVSALVSAFAADAPGMTEKVTNAYNAAERGEKARIRASVHKAAFAAFDHDSTVSVGRSMKSVLDGLVTVSEKAPIDLSARLGTMVANNLEAAFRIMSGNIDKSGIGDNTVLPDFVAESDVSGLRDFVRESLEYVGWDVPDFDPETVERLIVVKTGTKAPKSNDIDALVVEVFEDAPEGTFLKVSDIRRGIASNHPEKGVSGTWDGRVSAALFTNNDGKGVEGLISVRGGKNPVNPDIYALTDKNGAYKA